MSDEKGWHGRTYALKRLQICELPRNRVSRRHSLVSVYFSAQTGSATLRTPDMRRNRQERVTLVPPTSKNAHVCAHPALFGLNLAFPGGGVFLRDGFFFCTAFFVCAHRTSLPSHSHRRKRFPPPTAWSPTIPAVDHIDKDACLHPSD